MATNLDTLRSRETLSNWTAGVLAVAYLILFAVGPRNGFLLGVLTLLPFVIAALVITGAIAGTAVVVAEHQTARR